MASTYSTNLALELMATGEKANTWGDITNTNLGTLLEQAISGYVTQAITDGSGATTTITIPNGATGVARNMFIEMTGALTFSTTSLVVPANKKLYFIYNNTSGGYPVQVKVSGQTGVSVPNGQKMVLVSNGTDVVVATNYMATLALGSLTSGRVPYATTAGLLTDSANLTFNGTTLTANTIGAFTLSGTIAGGGNQINNVVIGTSTPLAGSFTTVSATTSVTTPSVTNAGTLALSATGANVVTASTNGSERMRIDSSGNVGIGTSSASSYGRLAVMTPTANYGYFGIANSAGGGGGIQMAQYYGTTKISYIDTTLTNGTPGSETAYMAFATANTGSLAERMRIDSSGNVGIGTTSSSYPLTVRTSGTSTTVGGNIGLRVESNGSGYAATLQFSDNVANSSSISMIGSATAFLQAGTEKMRIDTSGNLLLGTTTSPSGSKELVLGGDYIEGVVAIGTVTTSNTISLANGTLQTATLTASTACTFTMPTAVAGKSFTLLLKQAASTGNGTATFTSVKWGTAGAPTITATAGKMDILTFVSDGTNWYGNIAQGYTP